MKRVFGKSLKEQRQVLGLIDFNDGELSDPCMVLTEILEATAKPEGVGDGRGKRHRSQIIFAARAAKSLLQIRVTNFVRRQSPLLDQLRPQNLLIREPVMTACRAKLQTLRRLTHFT
jgi:hypothetical protein